MENDTTKNVAETIGNLILDGYCVMNASFDSIGRCKRMHRIVLDKRFAYQDKNHALHGFTETVAIDIESGDITITHMPIDESEDDE